MEEEEVRSGKWLQVDKGSLVAGHEGRDEWQAPGQVGVTPLGSRSPDKPVTDPEHRGLSWDCTQMWCKVPWWLRGGCSREVEGSLRRRSENVKQ